MDINVFKKISALLAGAVAFFFGSEPTAIQFVKALVMMQIFDFFVAMVVLVILGEKFDYRKFGNGILKKILFLTAVSFGYFVDLYSIIEINNVSFEKAFATAFIAMEVCSIAESFSRGGIKIPYLDKFIKMN